MRSFWIEVANQLGRILDVGKQHRDLLAFAFQGATGSQDLLREIGGRVRQWSLGSRRRGPGGGWGRGACLVRPDEALLVFAQRLLVGIAQLAEEIRQGIRIQLELPLQGAIGHTAPLPQKGNHLIHKRNKIHPLSPCLARVHKVLGAGLSSIACDYTMKEVARG